MPKLIPRVYSISEKCGLYGIVLTLLNLANS